MKSFLKLYAVISVSFIFGIFALVAIYPTEFLNFISEVMTLLQDKDQTIMAIYQMDLPIIEMLFSYLFGIYLVNIIANIVIAVLAYLTEDKFNSRIALYSLIVNVVFFSVIVYTAKLIVEGGFKSITRIFKK